MKTDKLMNVTDGLLATGHVILVVAAVFCAGVVVTEACTPGDRQNARSVVDAVERFCGAERRGAIVLPAANSDVVVICGKVEDVAPAASSLLAKNAASSLASSESMDAGRD